MSQNDQVLSRRVEIATLGAQSQILIPRQATQVAPALGGTVYNDATALNLRGSEQWDASTGAASTLRPQLQAIVIENDPAASTELSEVSYITASGDLLIRNPLPREVNNIVAFVEYVHTIQSDPTKAPLVLAGPGMPLSDLTGLLGTAELTAPEAIAASGPPLPDVFNAILAADTDLPATAVVLLGAPVGSVFQLAEGIWLIDYHTTLQSAAAADAGVGSLLGALIQDPLGAAIPLTGVADTPVVLVADPLLIQTSPVAFSKRLDLRGASAANRQFSVRWETPADAGAARVIHGKLVLQKVA